ncbi:clathrin interactor EPSIN 3-like [Asparagus officinalis]|uniref:clathrin interactor EPSIN 3-like n=1 Tax=Asparagus officinalis TaxID=4686 RepID=UPI00098E756F|nr:clathrin interactor EPSIN 3-like [Asparagus officinalis]
MKKVFGQTVRDLKRGVNKKVLKVSGIEQKILDATSNEPWGPHGTNLSEIAQATHNGHEYRVIMSVIWRRINDTGKKWRHVFKALTVLEYLVAHGSERVIDEIREHAYQISTLAEFQYIDSGGRDQGINVRKKSQTLVALVNDKERVQEIRQKAQANKAYKQSSYTGTGGYGDHHDDDRYGYSIDERNGYRDDERYGGGRNSDGWNGRDVYQDDSYRGHGNDNNQYKPRSRSIDGSDDDRLSSRSGGDKADRSPDERGLEGDIDIHNAAGPPSYEEATKSPQETIEDERDGESPAASAQASSSPSATKPTSSSKSAGQSAGTAVAAGTMLASQSNVIGMFDEFDPRGLAPAAQPPTSSQELDIFGFSASDSADPLALVPGNSVSSPSDTQASTVFGTDFLVAPLSASPTLSQAYEDPFGDAPFKATPQENSQAQPQHPHHVTSFQPSVSVAGTEGSPPAHQTADAFPSFNFGDALDGLTYAPAAVTGRHDSASPSFSTNEFPGEQSSNDILDSILPRNGSDPMFSSQDSQPAAQTYVQTTQMNPFHSAGLADPVVAHGSSPNAQMDQMNPFQPTGGLAPVAAQSSSPHPQMAEMNPFQPLALPAPAAPQESASTQGFFPTAGSQASLELAANLQTTQMNSSHQQGLSMPAASQGSIPNMHTSQMNFFETSGLSASVAPQESITNMQTTQVNFSQHSSLPVPAASQGSHPNMQKSEMNFFQPSGTPASTASQEPLTNMQTAHMSFPQTSGLSVPAASQGSPTNMQTSQMNFIQPSGLSPSASQQSQTNMQTGHMNFFQPSGLSASAASQGLHPNMQTNQLNFLQPSASVVPGSTQGSQTHMPPAQPDLLAPSGLPVSMASQGSQTNIQSTQPSFLQPSGLSAPVSSYAAQGAASRNIQAAQTGASSNMQTNSQLGSQPMMSDPFALQMVTSSAGPTTKPNPSKGKFETKSTVWADTLSRGLVNLDISGPKTNPLDDIGVDFDAINRKEKRLGPKTSAPPVTSTIIMGKAMGSGSGIGRSAATGLAPPSNPLMSSGMGGMGGGGGMGMMGMRGVAGMGMGAGGMGMGASGMGMGGHGMGMGGYGGNMNQPPMGMNMGMGMGPGAPMQPPGSGMPMPGGGGYNHMMGMGGYGSQNQQTYGGGYR